MINCGYGCCGCPMADGTKYKKLSELEIGAEGVIVGIDAPVELKFRIMEMGLTVGTPVTVSRKAPMSDPIAVSVRGYDLSLRLDEARAVIVNACPSLGLF